MSTSFSNDPQRALAEVQAIFAEVVPGAVCELQDYQHRIGCGMMDEWGNIQETIFLRPGMDEDLVRHHAERLKRLVASGGSTAG